MVSKTAPRKAKASMTANVEPEKAFWLSDGQVLKNMKDLAEALESMDNSVWGYHVTSEKNDFANWIEEVFGQKQLGAAIRKVKNPKTAAKRIQSKIEAPKFWSFLM